MATRYQGSVTERRALDAYIGLMRAAEAVTGRTHGHLEARGLTIGQFGALEALFHLGPMRATELARKLLRSPGNMTTVLDNLEKQGLVRRRTERQDRRCVNVVLEPKGEALVREIFPIHVAGMVRAMRVLGAAEQEELRRLCRKLGAGEGVVEPAPETSRPRSRTRRSRR